MFSAENWRPSSSPGDSRSERKEFKEDLKLSKLASAADASSAKPYAPALSSRAARSGVESRTPPVPSRARRRFRLSMPTLQSIHPPPSSAGAQMIKLDAKVRHLSERIDQLRPPPPGPRRQRALAAAAADARRRAAPSSPGR